MDTRSAYMMRAAPARNGSFRLPFRSWNTPSDYRFLTSVSSPEAALSLIVNGFPSRVALKA